jgi:ApaG protein
MPRSNGSETLTHAIRVRVAPEYLSDESSPQDRKFLFAYRVSIRNERDEPVRLVSRLWTIIDSEGESNVVRGEGVVGQQPLIRPGETFEYSSMCPLTTAWGTMEGAYTLELPELPGAPKFEAQIGRFYLVGDPQPEPTKRPRHPARP